MIFIKKIQCVYRFSAYRGISTSASVNKHSCVYVKLFYNNAFLIWGMDSALI